MAETNTMRTTIRILFLLLPLVAFGVGYAIPPAAALEVRTENPLAKLERAPANTPTVEGVVAQCLPAGPYTYLAVRSADQQEHWAVTLGRGATEGARVSLRTLASSRRFYSARLGRTFEDLSFALITKAVTP